MTELRDVADKFIPLEDVLFPEDKSKCTHIALDSTFIPIKKGNKLIGCIMKCANCGEIIKYYCPTCAVGAVEEDPETGEVFACLPCDLSENKKFVEGLEFTV